MFTRKEQTRAFFAEWVYKKHVKSQLMYKKTKSYLDIVFDSTKLIFFRHRLPSSLLFFTRINVFYPVLGYLKNIVLGLQLKSQFHKSVNKFGIQLRNEKKYKNGHCTLGAIEFRH